MGSGGGSGGGTTTSNTVTQPAPEFMPFILGALGDSGQMPNTLTNLYNQDPLDRITGFSDQTLTAMGGIEDTVFSGLGYLDQARAQSQYASAVGVDALASTPVFGQVASAYLDPATGMASTQLSNQDMAALGAYGNPAAATQAAAQAAVPNVISQINAAAGDAGRVGSGLYADAMGEGVARAMAPIYLQAQTDAANRGASLYDQAANRQTSAAFNALNLAGDQFSQGAQMINQGNAASQGFNDASLNLFAALGAVGGEVEALQDAYANVEYDNFDEAVQRLAGLTGLGGTTSSSVGTVSGGGGGTGLSKGLGGLLTGGALLSSLV